MRCPIQPNVSLLLFSLLATCGCRVVAPMHVWTPPELESVVGKRVGISEVGGSADIAGPIREKMLSMNPADSGRGLVAVDTQKLSAPQTIQLVSASIDPAKNDQPAKIPESDLATTDIARKAGLDYILRGQVETRNHQPKVDKSSLNEMGLVPFDPHQSIAVSWKLYSVKDNRPIGGKPVVIDGVTAAQLYPDLTAVADPNDALLSAVVRESYRLVSPSTREQKVQLAIPYLAQVAGQHGKRLIWRLLGDGAKQRLSGKKWSKSIRHSLLHCITWP